MRRTSSKDSVSQPLQKSKLMPHLDQYRHTSPAGSSRSQSLRRSHGGSSDEDYQEPASASNQPPPKKRSRFRRGKPPSSRGSSPEEQATSRNKVDTIVIDDFEDEGVPRKVQRLYNLVDGALSKDECLEAYNDCNHDVQKAYELLRKKRDEVEGPEYIEVPDSSSSEESVESTPRTSDSIHTGVNAIKLSQSSSVAAAAVVSGAAAAAVMSSAAAAMGGPSSWYNAKPPRVKKREIVVDTDSDGAYASSEDEHQKDARRDRSAVKWFNEANEQTLIETVGCSAAQAKIIADLRPFASAVAAEDMLRSTKGVTGKLFTDYVDVLAAFETVDEVLRQCEKSAVKLEKAAQPHILASDPAYLKQQPKSMSQDMTLKDYQLDGVNWLSLRYRYGTSCILADDMGTGKTCQVIAFLCDLKDREIEGVSLVVAPSSTVENWSRELDRFGPKLRVKVFAGSQAERREIRYQIEENRNDYDVVLASYNSATAATDLKFFKKFGFNACVFDEGHQLKNQNTNNYKALMQVRANWRLLLTGTPLQNNLLELMSLLRFIMPKIFKNASEAMETIFKGKVGSKATELSKSRVDRAKRMMLPFVLRRLKDNVLTLPPKVIRVEYCDMTPHQNKLYNKVLARTRLELLGQEGEAPTAKRGKKDQASNILMRLRKAAIHPMLFRTIYTADKIDALAKDYVKEPQFMDVNLQHLREDFAINSDAELSQLAAQYPATKKHQVAEEHWLNSGKIHALKKLIDEIKAKGEKLVIFSQFEMALFLLMSSLNALGISWIAFSGRTKVEERQLVIDEFQRNPDITCFLLTTKAGGVGVNLTAANWVILLDQDFNPQNDKQAEDRCWRIGQEKQVNVVKLISKGTIDEDILALGQKKLELAARVSGMEKSATNKSTTTKTEAVGEDGIKIELDGAGGMPEDDSGMTDLDLDDGRQQESAAQSLMSKLRSRAEEKQDDVKKEDADGEDDVEILDG